jgi:voltage-gated sodium channel
MQQIEAIINDKRFQNAIIGVILLNAVVLGLLTLQSLSPAVRTVLEWIDHACLVVFVAELVMKLLVLRGSFFRDGWNVFDFAVVAIALMPNTGALSVLRALRVLRVMRLATVIPSMRRVLNGMFAALPGGASVAGILFILYYVGAIVGTTMFRGDSPHFSDIGTTFFTLFQLMTLEGWNSIAETVMDDKPQAWAFFVVFIVFTNFTTLNLLFGIIVDAMEAAKEEEVREALAGEGVEIGEASSELRLARMEEDVKHIRTTLEAMKAQARAG